MLSRIPCAGDNQHRTPPAYPLGVCRNVERFADCTTCVKPLDERRNRVGVEYKTIPCVRGSQPERTHPKHYSGSMERRN